MLDIQNTLLYYAYNSFRVVIVKLRFNFLLWIYSQYEPGTCNQRNGKDDWVNEHTGQYTRIPCNNLGDSSCSLAINTKSQAHNVTMNFETLSLDCPRSGY